MAANWTDQDRIDLAEWIALSPRMQLFEIEHSRTPELRLPTARLPILRESERELEFKSSSKAANNFNVCTCGKLLPLELNLCPLCDSQKIVYLEERQDNWYIGPQFGKPKRN